MGAVKRRGVPRGRALRRHEAGCAIEARAYVDPSQWASSRCDIVLPHAASGSLRWDFTVDSEHFTNPRYYTSLGSWQARLPYGKAKQTVVPITLRHYDTLEERVTFRDLDLRPVGEGLEDELGMPSRTLSLKAPLTAVTPSGIRVTLPAQDETFMELVSGCYNGNAEALFIRIQTMPNTPRVALPQSPLWQKYHKPIQIQFGREESYWRGLCYGVDNTSDLIGIGLPNLRTATHLDTLTLIIRQRIDLQTVPVQITMPVSREAKARREGHS